MKLISLLLCLLLVSCATNDHVITQEDEATEARLLYRYEWSIQCRGCHANQYQEYESSMHAKAFSNPLFNAQYFNDVVPKALKDPSFVADARRCIACHAPTVFMNYTGLVSTPAEANRFETGVTCDFCHTLAGYAENGDYKQNPSAKKQGPFEESGAISHHSEYSGFLQLGDYCGRCHNATNHVGLEVKSTYYEWRESSYGKKGVACQECHMNRDGFLRKGNGEFDSGQAAYMNIGTTAKKQKEHDKLYTHSFPGAHSVSQLTDSVPLEFKVGTRKADKSGQFHFTLIVNNERSGHKMPSGSSDLRFMWISITATSTEGKNFPVILQHSDYLKTGKADYSIAGASPDDATIIQDDVPKGARLYRTVLLNEAGRQSLYQYDAVKNAFDNRLDAAEIRKEGYYLILPTGFSGKVHLEAKLYYRGAPSSFAKRMKIPDTGQILVASRKKLISVETDHTLDK